MAEFPIFEAAKLEIRRSGGMRILTGRFNYGSTATVRDRGRVRKERFESLAPFAIAIEDETAPGLIFSLGMTSASRLPAARRARSKSRTATTV